MARKKAGDLTRDITARSNGSKSVALPKEVLEALQVDKGDTIEFIIEDGNVRIVRVAN